MTQRINVIYLNLYHFTCVICEREIEQSPAEPCFGVARYEDEVVPDNYEGEWGGSPVCLPCYCIERFLHQEKPQAFISFADIKRLQWREKASCPVCVGRPISDKPCVCGGHGDAVSAYEGMTNILAETEARLAALDWTPISEENPAVDRDEIGSYFDTETFGVTEYLAGSAKDLLQDGWTHRRPQNPPRDPSQEGSDAQ